MSGGYRRNVRPRCARRLTAGVLGGLIASSFGVAGLLTDLAVADSTVYVDDCPAEPSEKSIVVENGKLPDADPDVALVTDEGADGLEPIANVSEYEPELADASSNRLQEALVPTLADPPAVEPGVAPASPGTPDQPISDDVCIEEEVTPTGIEPTPELHAASFNGVTPGLTTRAEVLRKWTKPKEANDAAETLTFELGSFPSIAISFNGDTVKLIRVELREPADCGELTAKLGLADFRPLVIADEFGHPKSTTFPERGVTLSHQSTDGAAMATDDQASSAAKGSVYEIVVRPISAAPFIVRADRAPAGACSLRIADLETALKINPNSPRALAMLAEVKLAASKAIAAEQLARQAAELAPQNDAYRLQWATCLKHLARYDEAVTQTRSVLEGSTASPIVRAAALEQMGQLAALGSLEVQQRSVPLHNKAIEVADSLATSGDEAVRAAAHRVLLDAHLAMAQRIAAGDWAQKDAVVAQWISRASALAEQMIAAGKGDLSLRLQVANSALAAGGRLHPPIDPQPWIAEAEQTAAALQKSLADDRLARDAVHWQLGMAYFQAAEIQHRRGEADLAIRYGEMADAALTPLADARADLPDTRYVLGRVYFQIGAVHAVHHQDHDMACQWYDRAVELLLEPAPFTPLASPGQHGDALVSMGVSYWELGQRERAYELTQAGVRLVDRGVTDGLLAAPALTVPQGNLNAMARALGKAEAATPNSTGGRSQMAQRPRTNARRSAQPQQQSRMATRSRSSEAGRR